jgi:hypothetical protein
MDVHGLTRAQEDELRLSAFCVTCSNRQKFCHPRAGLKHIWNNARTSPPSSLLSIPGRKWYKVEAMLKVVQLLIGINRDDIGVAVMILVLTS